MGRIHFDPRRLARHVIAEDLAVRRAFSRGALTRIEAEIAAQELRHAGELRFAVEGGLSPVSVLRGVTAQQRARELFSALRVWDTEENNGVLVYLLLADRAVEIVADRAIHAVAGDDQWSVICASMRGHFSAGRYEEGVVSGLRAIGDRLAEHFPASGSPVNELPDGPVVLWSGIRPPMADCPLPTAGRAGSSCP